MKDATLDQATKLLSIFKDVSVEKMQEILGSGFLRDLRDGDLNKVDRESFRRLLGLNVLLRLFATITVSITAMTFIVRDRINELKKLGSEFITGSNFEEWFFNQSVRSVAEQNIKCYILQKKATDEAIIDELENQAKAETTLAELFTFTEQQSLGQAGTLLVNGHSNIFYIRDKRGILRTVICNRNNNSWLIEAYPTKSFYKWNVGSFIFFRG